MNSNIFIDTSAFYAILDQDDANHRKAATTWADIIGRNCGLTTSNYAPGGPPSVAIAAWAHHVADGLSRRS